MIFRQSCSKYSGSKKQKSPPPIYNAEKSFSSELGGWEGQLLPPALSMGGGGSKWAEIGCV